MLCNLAAVPAKVDHEARRRDVAEAVWRVLATSGFAGLSLRSVASELGATTGLVTHYFPSKSALVRHALDLLHERTDASVRPEAADPGLPALRARLRAVLPDSPEARLLSRCWVGSWDLALADPELADLEAARYERWRGFLRPLVTDAIALGHLAASDPETLVDTLTAFTHGLVVQSLFDPARFPVERQHATLDAVLASLVRY